MPKKERGVRSTMMQGRKEDPRQDKGKEIRLSQSEALDMCIVIIDVHTSTWGIFVV